MFKGKDKQHDGPYEVSQINIYVEEQTFYGLLYFPLEDFKKPYPLTVCFHGFPQLFTLKNYVKEYKYLLELGFAFIVFNFRGYRFSEGKVSIKSQVTDALKIMEFVEKMAKNKIFDINNVNIIAHDFGGYISLILCSKIKFINKLVLISPILELKRHVYSNDFPKALHYINRFIPGNVRGIENVDTFIKIAKRELSKKVFQIENILKKLKINGLKIITGEKNKVTPVSEVFNFMKLVNVNPEIVIVPDVDYICIDDEEVGKKNEEIVKFFKN